MLGQFFGNPGEELGRSVSISGDGRAVAVGASGYDTTPNNNIGRVAFYRVNSAPEVSATTTQIYTVATPAMFMDDSLILIDQDPDEIITGATITITNGYIQSEDILSFDNTATPNISGSFNSGTGVLSLSGNDTVQNYQQALRNVKYQNTNATTPDLSDRTIIFKATDDDNSESEGATVVLSINTVPVINAPASLNANVATTLNLTGQLSITDDAVGGGDISVNLSVANGALALDDTGVTITGGGNGTLQIIIEGSIANINTALNTLTYTSLSAQTADTLAMVVDDLQGGLTNGNIAMTINAPPSLTLQSNTETFDEDTTLTFNTANSNLITVADSDTDVNVTLSAPSGTFTLSQTTGLTFISGANATKNMTISGTVANINAALDGLSYLPREDFFGNLAIDITVEDTFTATDGNQFSQSDTINLTINAVNDAPEINTLAINALSTPQTALQYFGRQVDITDDGTKAIVATSDNDKVYYYTHNGTNWDSGTLLPLPVGGVGFFFDIAMSNDGHTLVIGDSQDDETATDAGAAYIYNFIGSDINSFSDSDWEITKVLASDGSSGDEFGTHVAVSGDGLHIAIAAPEAQAGGVTGSEGQIYYYSYDSQSDQWLEQIFFEQTGDNSDSNYGSSVSLSEDGQIMLVGAESYQGTGVAYLYYFDNNQWNEITITASDGASGDDFGSSVSLSADGQVLLIGAERDEITGVSVAGSAYLYTFDGISVANEQKIFQPDPDTITRFGDKVSLSGDGYTATIGARHDDDHGSQSGAEFGFDVAISYDGNAGIIGATCKIN